MFHIMSSVSLSSWLQGEKSFFKYGTGGDDKKSQKCDTGEFAAVCVRVRSV